jgi:hypothetical protein
MNKTLEENIRDTKHNKKAKEVFLKLLGKQKSKYKGWGEVISQTLPIDKSDLRNEEIN